MMGVTTLVDQSCYIIILRAEVKYYLDNLSSKVISHWLHISQMDEWTRKWKNVKQLNMRIHEKVTNEK